MSRNGTYPPGAEGERHFPTGWSLHDTRAMKPWKRWWLHGLVAAMALLGGVSGFAESSAVVWQAFWSIGILAGLQHVWLFVAGVRLSRAG